MPACNLRSARDKENAPHSYKPQLAKKQNVVVDDRINYALTIQDKYRNTTLNLLYSPTPRYGWIWETVNNMRNLRFGEIGKKSADLAKILEKSKKSN